MIKIRGDLTAFDLVGGKRKVFSKTYGSFHDVVLPPDFGHVHDQDGELLDRCDVYLCRYRIDRRSRISIPDELLRQAHDYYGEDARLVRARVEIPDGPWQRVGVVETIWYTRYGKEEGPWFHPFEDKAELLKSRCCQAYLLRLPDGCIVNDRGYVWP